EAELDEANRLVDELERAAEHVLVERPRGGLIGHAEDDVVEAERLERRAGTHGAAPAAAFRRGAATSREIPRPSPAPRWRRSRPAAPTARIATACPARSAARSTRAPPRARCRRRRQRRRDSRTPPRTHGRQPRAWRRAFGGRPTRTGADSAWRRARRPSRRHPWPR